MALGNIKSRIGLIEIIFTLFLSVAWFITSRLWKGEVASFMFTISMVLITIYLLTRVSGILPFMELSVPTWTISAVMGIFIWKVLFAFLPDPTSSSSAVSPETGSIFTQFFSSTSFNQFLQGWLVPVTESLFILLGVALVAGFAVGKERMGKLASQKFNGLNALLVVLIWAALASLLHAEVASQIAAEGTFQFNTVLIHQFVSFMVMIAMSFFLFAPAAISSHMAKNLIIWGTPTGWVIFFAFCIVMDVIALATASKQERMETAKRYSAFKS